MQPAVAGLVSLLVVGGALAGVSASGGVLPLEREGGAAGPSLRAAASAAEAPVGEFVIDDRWLPAETGWFLFDVEITRDTTITAEGGWTHYAPAPAGAATVFQYPGLHPIIRGRATGGGPWFGASHEGTAVTCCPQPVRSMVQEAQWGPQSDGDRFEIGTSWEGGPRVLRAGERMAVAFLATDWQEPSELEIVLRSDPPAMKVSGPRTGFAVQVLDLNQEAFRAGTNVHSDWTVVAGEVGDALVRWTAREKALFWLAYEMPDGYPANLEVTLPNGTVRDNAPGNDVYGRLSGVTGAGGLEIRYTDVRATRWLESFQNGGEGVTARAILADLPWAVEGYMHDHWQLPG